MNCTDKDPNASFAQFIYKTYSVLHEYFSNLDHNKNENKTWFLMRFDSLDYLTIACLIVAWKFIRDIFMNTISKPCAEHLCNVGVRHKQRTEECILGFVNDVGFWFYALFLVQASENECNLYYKPSQIFENIQDAVPVSVKLFYFLQLSKYSFSIYSILYLDERRKDFPVMIVHHVVTLGLLTIAYVSRVVKAGLIVLIIHSVCDMFLNSSKIFLYSRPRTPLGNSLNKVLLYFSATLFTISWFYNRLYLYPLRAIYYDSFFPIHSNEGRIFGIAYLLLLLIFLMDIYWTYYLSKFLWRLFVYDRQIYDPIANETGKKNKNNTENIVYKKIY